MHLKNISFQSAAVCLGIKFGGKTLIKNFFLKGIDSFKPDLIGIDLGTCNTLFCDSEKILLNETSNLAFIDDNGSETMYAIGTEASELRGRTPFKINVRHPIQDGVVNNVPETEELIRAFLTKISAKKLTSPTLVVGVPFNATNVEQRALQEIFDRCNAHNVFFIYESLASAIGAKVDINKPVGNLVIDIGGGTTEISVISLNGIIENRSFRCAGQHIDRMIQEYLRHKYHLAVGMTATELIKKEIGTAFSTKKSSALSTRVSGRDLVSNQPKTITISAEDTSIAMAEFTNRLVDEIRAVLSSSPPELVADITNNGVILCGGGARIKNLDYVIEKTTTLKTKVASEPELCLIKGLQTIINDFNLYRKKVLFQLSY